MSQVHVRVTQHLGTAELLGGHVWETQCMCDLTSQVLGSRAHNITRVSGQLRVGSRDLDSVLVLTHQV